MSVKARTGIWTRPPPEFLREMSYDSFDNGPPTYTETNPEEFKDAGSIYMIPEPDEDRKNSSVQD